MPTASAPSPRQERGPFGRLSPLGIRVSASRASQRWPHEGEDQMNMALVIDRTCQGSPSARSARTIRPVGALKGV
jgi:hypothetical protein